MRVEKFFENISGMGNFSKFLCPVVFKIVFTLTFIFVITELS